MRVFTSSAALTHDPGPGHPDQPLRLKTVLEAVRKDPAISVIEATPASLDDLLACHDRAYLDRAIALSAAGGGELGADTTLSGESWAAVVGATGAVLGALDHSLQSGEHTFAAIRPPGHHALRDRAMGFCVGESRRRCRGCGPAAWTSTCAHHRLGRTSWEWDAGAGRARAVDALCFHASMAVVSRHRCER